MTSPSKLPTQKDEGVGFSQIANWLGSKAALGKPLAVFILLYPMAIGSVLGGFSGFELPLPYWLWDLLTGLGAAVVLFAAHLARVAPKVSVHLLAWVLASISSAALPILVSLGIGQVPDYIVAGTPFAALSIFGLLMLFTLASGAISEFRFSNAELFRRAQELELRRQGLNQELENRQQLLTQAIREALEPKISEVQTSLANSDSKLASEKILELIESLVRPLSHQLSDERSIPTDSFVLTKHKISLASFVRRSNRKLSVANLFAPHLHVIFALIFFGTTMFLAAGIDGVIFLVAFQVLQVLVFLAARKLFGGIRLPHFVLVISNILIAAGAALSFVQGALVFDLPDPEGLVSFVGLGIFLVFSSAGYVSIFNAAKAIANQEIREATARLSYLVGELQIRTASMRKQYATGLHGDIQAKLQAALVRLAKSESSEDVIEKVMADLAGIAGGVNGSWGSSPDLAQLWDLQSLWEGVCEVTLEITSEARLLLDKNAGLSAVVTEIIKERIVNAVKHSSAEEIDISIRLDSDQLVIFARNQDFGLGSKSVVSAGGGSRMLDEVSLSWNLDFEDQDVVFQARLAT